MLERLKRMIVSADIEEASYRRVWPELQESNRSSLTVFSVVTLIFLIAMMILSYISEELAGNRMLYSVSAVLVGLVALLSMEPAKKHSALVLPLVYLYSAVLLGFGIVLGTVTVPDEVTATYIALMLTVPQIFIDRPYRQYCRIFLSVGVFILMVITHKAEAIWNSDIVNSIVFGSVSAIGCTYTNKIKVERYCLEDTIRFMAENDQLTGLKNRNSYEQKLQNSSILEASSLYCVYVDVNGLHELNNTQGHAAGDRMLQFIATVMQNIFGQEDTYRIGGDEYVALGQDQSEEELREKITKLRQAVSNAGYHVAVGMNRRPKKELEITGLIKEAEKEMYADKRAYYQQNGIDRRSRSEG